MNETLKTALAYAARGWRVFPLRADSKITLPGSNGHLEATTDQVQILSWFDNDKGYNVGVRPTGFFVLDVDVKNGAPGKQSLAMLEDLHEPIPPTLTHRTPSGGLHYLLRAPDDVTVRQGVNVAAPGLDTRTERGYFLAAPSTIDGEAYSWIPGVDTIAMAPQWLLNRVKEGAYTAAVQDDNSKTIHEGQGRNNEMYRLWCKQAYLLPDDLDVVDQIVRHRNATKCVPPLDESEVDLLISSGRRWFETKGKQVTTVAQYRTEVDKAIKEAKGERKVAVAPASDVESLDDFSRTEHPNAIAARFLQQNRILNTVSGMYQYTGINWKEVSKTGMLSMLLRYDDIESIPTTNRRRSEALAFIEARQYKENVPWRSLSMNEVPFENGVLDLVSGEMREHRHEDYLEKVIPHDFVPGAKSGMWEGCLRDYFSCDAEYTSKLAALQEFFGYCLMQHARYKKGLMLYSKKGDTGKSTVKEMAEWLVGHDSTCHIGLDKMEDKFIMADIVGKLLNSVGEQTSGSRIADGKFKELIGTQEPIRVERKGMDAFSYTPIAKHIICTNNLPKVDDNSDAVYNRLLIIKFNKVITDKNKDIWDNLKSAEQFPGIVAWAVEGAQRLFRNNGEFTVIQESVETIKAYKNSQNTLIDFIEEFCEKMPQGTTMAPEWRISKVEFFDKYRLKTRDERVSPHAFTTRLQGLDLEPRYGVAYNNRKTKCIEGYKWRDAESNTPLDERPRVNLLPLLN